MEEEHNTQPEETVENTPVDETVESSPVEESPTGGELPKQFEHQPTQMFKAKSGAGAEETVHKRNWKQKLKDFFIECKRVLKITKKPDRTEFKTIVKVSGMGIVIIGLIGFLIHFIKELIL